MNKDSPSDSKKFPKNSMLPQDVGPQPCLAPLMDSGILQVGSRWAVPENPCLVNECVRVEEAVFVQQRNISCPQLAVPTCPTGFQLSCETSACCPSCHCGESGWSGLAGPGFTFRTLSPQLPEFSDCLAIQRNGCNLLQWSLLQLGENR